MVKSACDYLEQRRIEQDAADLTTANIKHLLIISKLFFYFCTGIASLIYACSAN